MKYQVLKKIKLSVSKLFLQAIKATVLSICIALLLSENVSGQEKNDTEAVRDSVKAVTNRTLCDDNEKQAVNDDNIKQTTDFILSKDSKILISYTGTKEIVSIPETVTTIAAGAFKNNTTVKSIVFDAANVKEIQKEVFSGCTSISQIKLSPGLTTVGENVFEGCTNLESIWIPKSVTSLNNIFGKTEYTDDFYVVPGSNAEEYAKSNGYSYKLYGDGSYKGWQKISEKWYYFNETGEMMTGWQKVNSSWYYLESTGAMATGWICDNEEWYYLENSGKMKTGWFSTNGSWYYLKNTGAMATGWICDNNDWYYLDETGKMAADAYADGYYVDSTGKWIAFSTGNYASIYDYISSVSKVENRNLEMSLCDDGYYRMYGQSSSEQFNVLQLTDIHITGTEDTYEYDIRALQTVYRMIKASHPDFIVITGDIIFGQDGYDELDGLRALDVVGKMMDAIGIPWTWTFGNHDHEFFDQYSDEKIERLLNSIESLKIYSKNESITGYTNGVFELCNANGSVAMGLIMLDSGNVIQKEDGSCTYDYIRDDQVNWYGKEVQSLKSKNVNVKTMVFMHIPIRQYNNAWDQGILAFGKKGEDVYCSSYDSNLFYKAVSLKSTVAMFCGHDHINTYGAFYNGIELVYGKSIDYIAYAGISEQTEQRGATLIKIFSDGDYRISQLGNFWAKEDGNWYLYDSSGSRLTGWVKDNGEWYYMYESGVMATGWVNDNETWYYLKSSGAMATGWVNDNGTWYYLKSSGAMATGWINSAGEWYYLSNNGSMSGNCWMVYNNNWYYLYKSGAMAHDTSISGYYVDHSGKWVY